MCNSELEGGKVNGGGVKEWRGNEWGREAVSRWGVGTHKHPTRAISKRKRNIKFDIIIQLIYVGCRRGRGQGGEREVKEWGGNEWGRKVLTTLTNQDVAVDHKDECYCRVRCKNAKIRSRPFYWFWLSTKQFGSGASRAAILAAMITAILNLCNPTNGTYVGSYNRYINVIWAKSFKRFKSYRVF